MIALDAVLKQTPPRVEAPASLHSSIMQAVRAARGSAPAHRPVTVQRWLPVPVLALLVLLFSVWVIHSPVRKPVQGAKSLVAASAALNLGDEMVRSMPPAMVAPLSEELTRLNRDLGKTAQFLFASLP
jgi:hypothetical protein